MIKFLFFKTLSSNDKQSIIKLLKETISQTTVQCCFYLSDNQETILNETQTVSWKS
jgi:hypothetical protein